MARAAKAGPGAMATSNAPTPAPQAQQYNIRYGLMPSIARLSKAREIIMDAQYPARIQETFETEPMPISRARYIEMNPPRVNSEPDSRKSRSANDKTTGERKNLGMSAIGSALHCLGVGHRRAATKTAAAKHNPAVAARIVSRE